MAEVLHWGSWPSPIGPEDAAAGSVRVSDPGFLDGAVAWVTTAADLGGDAALVAHDGAGPRRVTPVGTVPRSRLYLYGAGSWCATPRGAVVVDASTQSLVLVGPDGSATEVGERRHERVGDPVWRAGTDWVLSITEPAHAEGPRRLVATDLATSRRVELLETTGFLGDLACSPDGHRVAFTHWPAGTMAWDAAELWVAELAGGAAHPGLARLHCAEGGRGASCGQPAFCEDGSLAYVSEAAGIWQPWALDAGGVARRRCARRAEFQRPRWSTCRWLAPMGEGALACALAEGGIEHVGVLDADGELELLAQPCVRVDGLAAHDGTVAWVGATLRAQGAVLAATRPGAAEVLSSGPEPLVEPSAPVRFGFEAEERVEGWYWAPRLDGIAGPPTPPPLVVAVHPGPTGAVDASYAPVVHLLTSRGFAVASVDYAGSTGAGRAQRDRLTGRLGELDVAECSAAARHLASVGLAAPEAVFVRGTSSGGTTALLALAQGVFRGAVAWYPAATLVEEAAGFEAGYLAALGGPGAAARGPFERAGELTGCALVVQGLEDPIVAPAGTRALVERLRATLEHAELLELSGEGHGFRTPAGRAAALEAELGFYLAILRRTQGEDRYDSGTVSSP